MINSLKKKSIMLVIAINLLLFIKILFTSILNLKIFKLPFIILFNCLEYQFIFKNKKKKIKKKIYLKKLKIFKYCYNYLISINRLPKLSNKYFFINFYKLLFLCILFQNFIYIKNILILNIGFLNYYKKDAIQVRKRVDTIFLFIIQKQKRENRLLNYFKMLRRDYFSDYLIRYWISWVENRWREFRIDFWYYVEIYKEKFKLPFQDFYSSMILFILNFVVYLPFSFVNCIFIFLFFNIFKCLNFIYNEIYMWGRPKYLRLKYKIKKKKKRFDEYDFFYGFIAIIVITYTKATKTLPEYNEYYRRTLKFTKLGKIFGPIYNLLKLWNGFWLGRWRGMKH